MGTPTPTPRPVTAEEARKRLQEIRDRTATPTSTPTPVRVTAEEAWARLREIQGQQQPQQQRVPEAEGRGFLQKVSELDKRIKDRWPGIVGRAIAKPFTTPFSAPGDQAAWHVALIELSSSPWMLLERRQYRATVRFRIS